MEKENLILVSHYCQQTRTSVEFIESLQEYGFIEVLLIEEHNYVNTQDIVEIERVNRLQQELGINLEGIDALNHVLRKVDQLKKELKTLQDRLRIYES
ncbi:chaperone modulator CbpM [Maribacter chungangensis]|uniref:Chaperone modulator CbpM n=1 Tax=Maribacter chungangensis TaxID=1069117 RepID=A0ABW3B9D9_9FLAO